MTAEAEHRLIERRMAQTTQDANINVIIEQLNTLRESMDEIKSALRGVDSRLSALELNDVSFRTAFDARLNAACTKLGEHDGVAIESRQDRKEIRTQITDIEKKLSILENNMKGFMWIGGVVIVAVVLDIVARFMHLV
jgi:hypothetical protein